MTNPNKVIGFLDITRHWDPSLALVMVGAIFMYTIAFHLQRKIAKPFFSNQFQIPSQKKITLSLMIGSFIFGVGWGLAGFCPGPGITAVFSLHQAPHIFVLSMIVGMVLFQGYKKTFLQH